MAKGKPAKVNINLFDRVFDTWKNRKEMYSQCIQIHFRDTGRFDTGFDNVDLQAYIDAYYGDCFDKKGDRIK